MSCPRQETEFQDFGRVFVAVEEVENYFGFCLAAVVKSDDLVARAVVDFVAPHSARQAIHVENCVAAERVADLVRKETDIAVLGPRLKRAESWIVDTNDQTCL